MQHFRYPDKFGSRVDHVSAYILSNIESGQFAPGTRLPSVRNCAKILGVSCETAVKAYAGLVSDGYVEARARSGFYVISRNSAGSIGSQLFSIRERSNPATLEQLISRKLRKIGVRVEEGEIMVTAGKVDTLQALVRSCMRAGEKVLVEDPAPCEQRSILMAHGIHSIAVPRMHDGPDIDALRELCKLHAPRVFLCSTAHHDPTSSHCSAKKALQLLRLADSFDLTIVEDDSFSDLLPPNGPDTVSCLASLDDLERVIYVGGFTSTLGRQMGVDFIAARPAQIAKLRSTIPGGFDIAGSLNAEIVAELLVSGRYERHCDHVRSRLELQRKQLADELRSIGIRDFNVPVAGSYLWVSIGETMSKVDSVRSVFGRGPAFAPGSWFSDSAAYSTYVRIDVSIVGQYPQQSLKQGLLDLFMPQELSSIHDIQR